VDHLPPARRVAPTIVIGAWAALVAITLAGEAALWRGVEGDVAAFDIATALRPWDPHTTLIAAESLSARVAAGESGLAPTALEWARRAHAQNPASVPAGKALVTAALAQRDLGLAAATAEQLIESYPTQPWLTARLGAIRLLQGDREAAERLLLRATELDPSTADPWLTLAFLYDQAGETEKAQAATSRAAELSR
jgi:Flp pilus assembly protein TadD